MFLLYRQILFLRSQSRAYEGFIFPHVLRGVSTFPGAREVNVVLDSLMVVNYECPQRLLHMIGYLQT